MKNILFNWCAMLSKFIRSFGPALVLRGNKIRRSVSDGPLADSRCSAAIDLSNALAFFAVGAYVTGMVFPFQKTVVDFCTGSVLTLKATMVVMLGRAGECKFVGAGRGA